jgi:hypothetical protein
MNLHITQTRAPDFMKQNGPPFCALAPRAAPRKKWRFPRRRTTKRIPNVASARVCAKWQIAELVGWQRLGASDSEKRVDKTSKNLQRQHVLSFCARGPDDKMLPPPRRFCSSKIGSNGSTRL